MSNDKMRAEFEEWGKSIGMSMERNPIDTEDYNVVFASIYWQAWQASRASQVVELPDWSEYDTPRQYMDAVTMRLISLGVDVQ